MPRHIFVLVEEKRTIIEDQQKEDELPEAALNRLRGMNVASAKAKKRPGTTEETATRIEYAGFDPDPVVTPPDIKEKPL